MSIRGNTVGMTMPRTNYEQTDPSKADYLKGKEILDATIKKAQDTADAVKQTVEKMVSAGTDSEGNETSHVTGGNTTIINVSRPVNNTDAANKEYVDEAKAAAMGAASAAQDTANAAVKRAGDKMEGDLDMGGFGLKNVPAPTENGDAVNKAYADAIKATAEAAVKRAGDTMGGILNMGGFQVKNMAAPTESGDAVNKEYADAIASAYEQVYVNSNPSAEFAAQDIAVSGLSGWDMIHITFCLSASYSTYRVCKTFVNGNGTFYINAVIPGDTAVQVFRTFVFGDNKISVGDCYAGTSKQNTGLIPVSIHVAKFGKGGGGALPAAEGVEFG